MQARLIVTTQPNSILLSCHNDVHVCSPYKKFPVKFPVAVTTVLRQKELHILHWFHFSDPQGKMRADRDPPPTSKPVHQVLTEACLWQSDQFLHMHKEQQHAATSLQLFLILTKRQEH